MADDQSKVYAALNRAYDAGIPVALVTILETQGSMPRHAGTKMLVYSDGTIVGTIGGGLMESRVINDALDVLRSGQIRTQSYTLNNIAEGDPGLCGGTAKMLFEPIQVKPTLLVIGGGHTGRALAELGRWAEFRVILSDDREEFCNPEYVPDLDDYVVCPPDEIANHITINSSTYVAAVTRGLPIDVNLIPSILEHDAAYVGLIGSKRRWALTREALKEQHDLSDDQLNRIHSPIGLELEAETPREIALSIMAEIIMVMRGGTGDAMKWTGKETESVK